MTRVAGPVRRLLRNRPRLIATSLLALTALAASVLQSTAATVLQATLDANWRGTYDILVTQGGKDPVTEGLLRSDALVDSAVGRLSLEDLEFIRGLPGVDVAAPITEVAIGNPSLVGPPAVWLPLPVRADASLTNPQAFRITVESTAVDGTTEHELATQVIEAFAYQPSFSELVFDSSGAPLVGDDGEFVYATTALADSPRLLSADNTITFASGVWDPATGTIPIGLSIAPRPVDRVVLVDPVAERELLGDAGSFLDPLIDYRGDRRPLIALSLAPPSLTVTVTVEEFDQVTPGLAGAEAAAIAQGAQILQNGQVAPRIIDDSATTVLADYDVGTAPLLEPFQDADVLLGGLGADVPEEVAGPPQTDTANLRSLVGAKYRVRDDSAQLDPRGYSAYGQYAEAPMPQGPPGSVTVYTKFFGSVGTQRPEDARQPLVVGQVDVDALREALGEASFMPLGEYDLPVPVLADGTALATSITGFGVPGTNELAIGDLAMLDGYGVDRPISAIRVRVTGLGGYGPEAQSKLLEAASALQSLGYTATIVAGSSPQQMPVLVSGYALPETGDRGGQLIGDLGTITQPWSRLGAVVEAETAVSATSVALLAICVVAVGVLLAVVQLGAVPARRADAGVLRQLGWRRARIARWYLAEEAVAFLVVAIVGAAAVALASVRQIALGAVLASVALVLVTSLVAVVLGARAPRATVRRMRTRSADLPPRVTGAYAFGTRLARTNLAGTIALSLAVLLIVLAAAIVVTLAVQGLQLGGPSELAALAAARAWIPQGVLVAVTLAAGVMLAVVSRRFGVGRRREQWAAIRAMGWTTRDVVRAQLAELTVGAIPGALLGVVLSAVIARAQAPDAVLPVILVGAGAAVLAVAVVLVTGRKLD